MNTKMIFRWRYLLPHIEIIAFEWRDLWIGVYWNKTRSIESPYRKLVIYICLIPTFPLKFTFEWGWDYKPVSGQE